jgi:hypothetical protein
MVKIEKYPPEIRNLREKFPGMLQYPATPI